MIDTALAQVSDAVDGARNAVLENTTLAVALGATALVFYWFTKKIFKLALYTAIAGAGAWYWYFNIRA